MLIYVGSSVIYQATALAIMPVLTRYLKPEEYGYTALFTSVVSFLGPVVGASLATHIARNYFKKQHDEIAQISLNSLVGIAANTTVVVLVCGLVAGLNPTLIGLPPFWLYAAVLVSLADSVATLYLGFLRVQGRAMQYGAFGLVAAFTNLGVSLYLVAGLSWDWRGRAAGIAVSAIGMAVFALLSLRAMGLAQGSVDLPLLRQLYRISLPLVPHTVALRITSLSSRFFLDRMAGKEALGLYTVGYTFGSVIGMVTQGFSNAWTPWVFKKLAARERKCDAQIVQLMYVSASGLFLMWLAMCLVLPQVLRLATAEAYHSAGAFIAWVALSCVFEGLYTMLLPLIIDEGKTDAMAIFTGVVAALSLASNYALIREYGAMGAAYTALICAVVKFLLVFWHANRVRPMPWLTALQRSSR